MCREVAVNGRRSALGMSSSNLSLAPAVQAIYYYFISYVKLNC
jgi:hypothetical protein